MLRNKESNVKGVFSASNTRSKAGASSCRGMTIEEVMKEYDLKREDILNALSYAATLMKEEEIRVAK